MSGPPNALETVPGCEWGVRGHLVVALAQPGDDQSDQAELVACQVPQPLPWVLVPWPQPASFLLSIFLAVVPHPLAVVRQIERGAGDA